MSYTSFLTEATCGDACWKARENVCRCSCGGANHGIMKSASGTQPVRTRKIGGRFYELVAVGVPYVDAMTYARRVTGKGYVGNVTQPEPIIRSMPNASQAEKWPEVKAVIDANPGKYDYNYNRPYLLWGDVDTLRKAETNNINTAFDE